MLRDMFDEIDEWLAVNGGEEPIPQGFKRFARHSWCVRLLSRKERIRVSKLRYRIDMIMEEADATKETEFWETVERNDENARTLIPSCLICTFDLRNESFVVNRLSCGHMFHQRCIDRHLVDNNNPRCPNCNTNIDNAGGRVHFNYQ